VKVPATVEGRDRLRLFCALKLPRPTVKRIAAWQAEALSSGRVVVPEHLHITLAFLGARPAADLAAITAELRAAARAAAARPVLRLRGYRETRSVGMLLLQDEGRRATAFATDVHGRLERIGVYRPERRQWLPHVTVLRFRARPHLRPALPDLGEVSLSEAAVYHSVLRPTGAQYEILEAVALGG
jgi:RNA 2',3'-cyclic 3'-phosphodiesterase